MALTISAAAAQAMGAALATDIGSAATIDIRSGSKPATPETTATGTLLATGTALLLEMLERSVRDQDEMLSLYPLPILARGAAMRFLLTRLVDWLAVPDGALVRPKDPLEYYRKLRFHQSVKSVEDYGL